MGEKKGEGQYVHCTAVPARQTLLASNYCSLSRDSIVVLSSHHTNKSPILCLTNRMATEPQTAAGQRPVEVLAAKLKRRYALLSTASNLSTATKTSDRQASSRVSSDSTGDRASSAPGRVESAISEYHPASGDHQKRRAETDRGSAKRCLLTLLLLPMGVQTNGVTHTEHTVGNTARRLLHHVREEYNNASKGEDTACATEFSIANFVLQGQPRRQAAELKAESTLVLRENDSDDPDSFARTLKPVVMEAIQDILDELETVYDNIAKSAKDHIHSECVLYILYFILRRYSHV